jgi:hypothetical protein
MPNSSNGFVPLALKSMALAISRHGSLSEHRTSELKKSFSGTDAMDSPREKASHLALAGSTEKPFELLLLGDCMLGRLFNETLENAPPEFPWVDTLPILQSADWRPGNLRGVLSDRKTPCFSYQKPFYFRSDAKNVASLEAAKINAVSIANHHVLGYGCDAMFEMLEILDRAKIISSGAGRDDAQALRLATTEVGG